MTRTMLIRTVVVGLGAVVTCGSAQAQAVDRGWYLGASLGRSDVEFSPLTVTGATATNSNADDNGNGFKALGGYRFNRNFAIEGGWTDFGKFRNTTNVTAPGVGSASASIKVDGWHIDAVGILPIQGAFSLHGKLGAMYSTTKTTYSSGGAVVFAAGTNLSPRRREGNFKWGIGAGYEVNKNFGLRLEYDQVRKVGDSNTGEGDVGLWTLGGVIRF